MKKLIISLMAVLFLSLIGTGCRENSYFEDNELLSKDDEADYKDSGEKDIFPQDPEDKEENEESEENKEQSLDSEEKKIFVYVLGAVNSPGVYELQNESRVFDAVEIAGGLRDDADLSSINMAKTVSDEDMIYIFSIGEERESINVPETLSGDASSKENDDGRVNLNTATKEQLLTLPGIGEQKANAIIDYREKNGSFKEPEDIKNIPGIKDGVFQKIKDSIKTGD